MRKDYAAFTIALPVMTRLKGAPDKVMFRAATPPPSKAYARKRGAHWLQNTWHADSAAPRRLPNSTFLVSRLGGLWALAIGIEHKEVGARQTCLDLGTRGSS
jgi:hypothetical protein